MRRLFVFAALCFAVPTSAAPMFMGLGHLPGDLLGWGFASSAGGVSADGSVVVGSSSSALGAEAFRWTEADGMVGLGVLAEGFFTTASDVSADGSVVVGNATPLLSNYGEAFWWTEANGMVGLGFLPGGTSPSVANGVSADGSIIVGSSSSALHHEAFRWEEGTGMVGLGVLGENTVSLAYGVSADGSVVVGLSVSTLVPAVEAFRWTEQDGMVGLGDLAGGTSRSYANDVSADGSVIVGVSNSASGDEAFIWDATNGIRELDQVLVDDFGLDLTGWTLSGAQAISDDGRTIVGYGTNPSGYNEGWIATIPETPACTDGLDNEGDGLSDYPDDAGCADADDLSERSPLLVCDDGLDNDGDGLNDYPGDPGCESPFDDSERSPDLVCDDGANNDSDSFVDIADPACSSGNPYAPDPSAPRENTECQDGINNDGQVGTDFDGGVSVLGVGNGDPDGPDPQCAGKPWQDREAVHPQRRSSYPCGLGSELALLLPPLMWLWRRRGRRP